MEPNLAWDIVARSFSTQPYNSFLVHVASQSIPHGGNYREISGGANGHGSTSLRISRMALDMEMNQVQSKSSPAETQWRQVVFGSSMKRRRDGAWGTEWLHLHGENGTLASIVGSWKVDPAEIVKTPAL